MNETSSVFLATLLLAIGGAGFYFYKNSSENNHDNDDDNLSENISLEENNINEDDYNDDYVDDYEYSEPIKIKKKLQYTSNKSKKHTKKNISKTKRRY